MYFNLLPLYLSNHRCKKTIYQLRQQLKIYEINQRLKLWARLPVAISSCSPTIHPLVSSSRKNGRVKTNKITNVQQLLFFTLCLNVTFTNNGQNLRIQQCSSKAVNGNMDWMFQTEITFLHGKLCANSDFFFREDGREVQKFTDQQSSQH